MFLISGQDESISERPGRIFLMEIPGGGEEGRGVEGMVIPVCASSIIGNKR